MADVHSFRRTERTSNKFEKGGRNYGIRRINLT